jgi:hypothetical protein
VILARGVRVSAHRKLAEHGAIELNPSVGMMRPTDDDSGGGVR